jgi:hypothetical protein
MINLSRPRPERADSPELAAFRRLKVEQPELAGAVDMQVEIVVLQHRVQARLTTPWLEFDRDWLAAQLSNGRPVVRFEEVPFDWSEFRTLFRQVSEVAGRYDLLEAEDAAALQEMVREGRPSPDEVEAWYAEHFNRPRGDPGCTPAQSEAVSQMLTMSARPFLARTVDALHQRVDLAPWTRPYCPFCGGDPEIAFLPRSGERRLVCGRCVGSWPFPTHACPHCGNTRPGFRTSFASSDRRYQLIGCDVCRRYIKAFDTANADRPFLLDVDTIATLPLDAVALQRGYLS